MGWIDLFRKAGALYLATMWASMLFARLIGWRGFAHLSAWFLLAIGSMALFALWHAFNRKQPNA